MTQFLLITWDSNSEFYKALEKFVISSSKRLGGDSTEAMSAVWMRIKKNYPEEGPISSRVLADLVKWSVREFLRKERKGMRHFEHIIPGLNDQFEDKTQIQENIFAKNESLAIVRSELKTRPHHLVELIEARFDPSKKNRISETAQLLGISRRSVKRLQTKSLCELKRNCQQKIAGIAS